MLDNSGQYYFAIGHRSNDRSNLLLGHAAPRLIHEAPNGTQSVRQVDHASAIRPGYSDHTTVDDLVDVNSHINKTFALLTGSCVLGSSVAVTTQNPLVAFAVAATGFLAGAYYGGHVKKPGVLRQKEPDAQEDLHTYYKIPISEDAYQRIVTKIDDDQGMRDFSLWGQNCARYVLDILEDELNIELPVSRRWPMEALDITTPRFVQRIAEALREAGVVTNIEDLKPETPGY